MNIEYVRGQVSEVAKHRHDNEKAHDIEDELYKDVLTAISEGIPEDEAKELAREALKSKLVKFVRWYA